MEGGGVRARKERCGQERDESGKRRKVERLNERSKLRKESYRVRVCAAAAPSSLAPTPTFPSPPGLARSRSSHRPTQVSAPTVGCMEGEAKIRKLPFQE